MEINSTLHAGEDCSFCLDVLLHFSDYSKTRKVIRRSHCRKFRFPTEESTRGPGEGASWVRQSPELTEYSNKLTDSLPQSSHLVVTLDCPNSKLITDMYRIEPSTCHVSWDFRALEAYR